MARKNQGPRLPYRIEFGAMSGLMESVSQPATMVMAVVALSRELRS